MDYWIYMMASRRNGTLYVGVTSQLIRRAWQHRHHVLEGFTSRYAVDRLVWFESTPSIEAAIRREKQIKEWKRRWKIELIEKANPYWRDLLDDLLAGMSSDPEGALEACAVEDAGFRLSPE